ncbi:MAG: glucose-6-phosphate dehydrogenase [Planctomycetes bacterium]|nr:glucose-6-phosphate dehydrogenase [Planctomycetota bacterium]
MEASSVIPAEPVGGAAPVASPVRVAEPFTLVIFGATGDLTSSKLLPALLRLWRENYFAEPFAIVGVGRRDKNDAQFRNELREAAEARDPGQPAADESWARFAASIFYHRADFNRAESYPPLAYRLHALESQIGLGGNRLFYLATEPDYFPQIVEQLAAAGLLPRDSDTPWTRVVIEKPFGKDLASARALDQRVLRCLREEQVFRIDHYLGKETVQNLLAFRFGNGIFEPLFNRRYVDHVQITMAEADGMAGRRGAYYDQAGALRDVVQNHLLQLLALVAMEPPASLAADDVRVEKGKVLRNLVPIRTADVPRQAVRGQYGPGLVGGRPIRGYREEEAVAADSATETFVALRAEVDNWRWAGVPFLLRAGKRLPRRVTEVAVEFKRAPTGLFTAAVRGGGLCDRGCDCGATCECCNAGNQMNTLVFRIQPDEGISLSFAAKRPGMRLVLGPVEMAFGYAGSFDEPVPEAYERLLLDALRGDPTLFLRSDEVAAAWTFVDPILAAWRDDSSAVPNYAAGTWGPAEADRLVSGCRAGWREP